MRLNLASTHIEISTRTTKWWRGPKPELLVLLMLLHYMQHLAEYAVHCNVLTIYGYLGFNGVQAFLANDLA
jgi:hypothetical protein